MRAVDDESIPLTLNGKKILPDKKSLNFSQPKKVCAKGQTFRDGFCCKCIKLSALITRHTRQASSIFSYLKYRCFNQNSLTLHCWKLLLSSTYLVFVVVVVYNRFEKLHLRTFVICSAHYTNFLKILISCWENFNLRKSPLNFLVRSAQ